MSSHFRAPRSGGLLGLAGLAMLVSACQVAATGVAAVPGATHGQASRGVTASKASASMAIAPLGPSVALWPGGELPASGNGGALPRVAGDQAVVSDSGASLMPVEAAAGGIYQSADGTVQATIPPGALDRDAKVSFARIGTDDLPYNAQYLPGVRFQADLGGARIQPGHSILVKTLVDPDTAARLQASVPASQLADVGLSRDAAGKVYLTMPIEGPAVDPQAPATPKALPGWIFQEFGGLPWSTPAVVAASPAQRHLLDLGGMPAGPVKHLAAQAPQDFASFHALEEKGIFGCDAVGACLFQQVWNVVNEHGTMHAGQCGVAFDGDAQPGPGMQVENNAPKAPPGQARPADPLMGGGPPLPVPTHVTWLSDDPALNGQPVPDAVVRFRLPSGPGLGPNEVVADRLGNARSFAPAGTHGYLQAATPGADPQAGPEVDAVVQPGMPTTELQVPSMYPVVMMRLTSDHPLPSKITVTYELTKCGCKHDIIVDVPAGGGNSAVVTFKVPVPADARGADSFKIDEIQTDGAPVPVTLPPTALVQRNMVVPLDVRYGGPEEAK